VVITSLVPQTQVRTHPNSNSSFKNLRRLQNSQPLVARNTRKKRLKIRSLSVARSSFVPRASFSTLMRTQPLGEGSGQTGRRSRSNRRWSNSSLEHSINKVFNQQGKIRAESCRPGHHVWPRMSKQLSAWALGPKGRGPHAIASCSRPRGDLSGNSSTARVETPKPFDKKVECLPELPEYGSLVGASRLTFARPTRCPPRGGSSRPGWVLAIRRGEPTRGSPLGGERRAHRRTPQFRAPYLS